MSRQSGFTLVEMVIGSAVMIGIITSAYLCLVSGNKGQQVVERRLTILQHGRVALDRLAQDLRSACVLAKAVPFVGMDRKQRGMAADNLDFATHHFNPTCEGQSDFCEVSYFVDRNPRAPGWSLFRRRDPTPDLEPLAGGFREEIVPGVRGFNLEYYDGFQWHDRWGSALEAGSSYSNDPDNISFEMDLPDAVRISLALGEEEARADSDPSKRRPPFFFTTTVCLQLAGRSRKKLDNPSSPPVPEEAAGLNGDNPPLPGRR